MEKFKQVTAAVPERETAAHKRARVMATLQAPESAQSSDYGVAILAALGAKGKHVYGGTVPHATRAARRARGRQQRASRRANR